MNQPDWFYYFNSIVAIITSIALIYEWFKTRWNSFDKIEVLLYCFVVSILWIISALIPKTSGWYAAPIIMIAILTLIEYFRCMIKSRSHR